VAAVLVADTEGWVTAVLLDDTAQTLSRTQVAYWRAQQPVKLDSWSFPLFGRFQQMSFGLHAKKNPESSMPCESAFVL